jgi:hypothetical protein
VAEKTTRRLAKLERLLLAVSDMDDTAAAARYLAGTEAGKEKLDWRARRAMEAGMFVSYARAFNASRGDPPLPAAPTSGLSSKERETHKWAIRERDQVWAHVDRDSHRQLAEMLLGTPSEPSGIGLVEMWRPPSQQQLLELADLAESLRRRYRAEADVLYQELDQEAHQD